MTVFLALIAILVPASVTLIGLLYKQQSEKRMAQEKEQSEKQLDQEHKRSEKRLAQEQKQENDRLRLDAAMHAADLFGPSGDAQTSAAKSASGSQDSFSVSTETAIQVIDEALESGKPEVQVMAAELLCRNAHALDICQSLHWPSAVNSRWIPELPVTAKLLIVDALVHMALANEHTKNAVRELAVRLYGVWNGDPEPRVQGAIGTLMSAIISAVRSLGYTDFIQGPGHSLVKLTDMEQAVASANPHPDGYIEELVKDRSAKLKEWSRDCTALSLSPGMLATSGSAVRGANGERP